MMNNSKILIVDDEVRLCDSLEVLLCNQGYEVKKCNNGHKALELVIKNEFDLILMDIYMESLDGFQVIENIANLKIKTPVIVMTGSASTHSAVKALRMGVADYLKKPFKSEELYASVKNTLNQTILKKKLKESDNRYKALVNAIPQGIQISDLDGKITFSNPAHHKIYGKQNGELIGLYIWDFIADEVEKVKIKKYYNFLIRELPKPEPYFTIDKTEEGRLLDIQINWDYIRDSEGKLNGIISVISDISERVKAAKEKEKILKSLQEALENVKTLSGFLPICASCKKIRDDKGYWSQVETYIQKNSYAKFTHGLCPECQDKFYGKDDWYIQMKKNKKKK